MTEAISLAKELNAMHALAVAQNFAAALAYAESNVVETERHASDLIELSARYHFGHWMAIGSVYRGWARSVSGNTADGILWIEEGIRNYRATGAALGVPNFLMLKAEALYLADRSPEALAAIKEAEILARRIEVRCWSAELQLLSSVFLATTGADETQIEASFFEAIRIAREQKSISLEKRVQETYAEYRRQKASGSVEQGFRLPIPTNPDYEPYRRSEY